MKFKSITMENFMRYKGVNTIEFSCDPGKNVTVVLGDNTVGKTTIAQAFRFGLYGAVNMEKWKNADDYQLLNNDVLAFMDADSKAAVSVTIVAADEEKQYTICRKTIYSRNYPQMTCREFQKKVSMKIADLQAPDVVTEVDERQVEYVINELFPRNLSHYFLFDGERWSDVTVNGVRENIKESVHSLTGLSSYQAALLHLKDMGSNSVTRKFKSKITGDGMMYDSLENDRMRIEHMIEKEQEHVKNIDINIKNLFLDSQSMEVFVISRLPRLLAILCTGVGMSVAGLIMQQLCMNKFVSPTTGATISSAQFGILLALIFVPDATIWGRAIFAFISAILGTWIFVWFIQRIQYKDIVMVPLVGIMFGNVIGGVTNFLAYKYEVTQALSTWLVGHFSMVLKGRYEIVYLTVPLVVLAFIFANHFNIVGMGKDFSKNLGVPYNLVLFAGLTIAAMITASIIVVVGSISYIGLIVPNVVAMFKGDKIRGTLVDTALFGALFVLVCDIIGRVIIMPYELPIELIVGILGSLIFVALLIYRLKHGRKIVNIKLFNEQKEVNNEQEKEYI